MWYVLEAAWRCRYCWREGSHQVVVHGDVWPQVQVARAPAALLRCASCGGSTSVQMSSRPATLDDLRSSTQAEREAMLATERCTPLRGYRWWRLKPGVPTRRRREMSCVLTGVAFGQLWLPCSDGWVHAVCCCWGSSPCMWSAADHIATGGVFGGGEFDPACGFYALATLDMTDAPWGEGLVFGEVELAGLVVVHEHGYRASQARPLALYGPEPGLVWILDRTGARRWRVTAVPCRGLPTWPLPLADGWQGDVQRPSVRIIGWEADSWDF